MKRVLISILILTPLITSCGSNPPIVPEDPKRMTIKLKSEAFEDGGKIPKAFTCDGEEASPPLSWTGAPAKTKSFVITCDDPDASYGIWSHWVLFSVSGSLSKLPRGLASGKKVIVDKQSPQAEQGTNDFGKHEYGGPCPPSGTHHYVFRIYALDVPTFLATGNSRDVLLKAAREHILAEGKLVGTYSR